MLESDKEGDKWNRIREGWWTERPRGRGVRRSNGLCGWWADRTRWRRGLGRSVSGKSWVDHITGFVFTSTLPTSWLSPSLPDYNYPMPVSASPCPPHLTLATSLLHSVQMQALNLTCWISACLHRHCLTHWVFATICFFVAFSKYFPNQAPELHLKNCHF